MNAPKTRSIISVPAQLSEDAKLHPKPTKREIIKAMVQRARDKWQKECEELEKKRDAVMGRIHAASIQLISEGKFSSLQVGRPHSHKSDSIIHCDMDVTSPQIASLIKEFRALSDKWPRFDEQKFKQAIELSMSGGDRVARILANPEMVTALDAMLEEVGA